MSRKKIITVNRIEKNAYGSRNKKLQAGRRNNYKTSNPTANKIKISEDHTMLDHLEAIIYAHSIPGTVQVSEWRRTLANEIFDFFEDIWK